MEKLFHLKENGTNVKTEVMAGITTFLAMAYILAVNPSMLGFTARMYAIARNVVIPAMTSVFTLVPFSFR